MAYVLYEVNDHIATITLNRPDRMNALGRERPRGDRTKLHGARHLFPPIVGLCLRGRSSTRSAVSPSSVGSSPHSLLPKARKFPRGSLRRRTQPAAYHVYASC